MIDVDTAIRLPIIGIMGSGSPMPGGELAFQAGALLAQGGCHLLTGGGDVFMAMAAQGFLSVPDRRGKSLAILPAEDFGGTETPEGYPNPWVEIPIRTQLSRSTGGAGHQSRNLTNILTADGVIFLPGGPGTYHELSLAHAHDRPRILFLGEAGRINNRVGGDLAALANAAGSAADLQAFIAGITPR